ncbi:MAG TPA: FAD/NAD(P)-binding protein [Acidimicrobiales bacterium]|nr:FAD/NAD(P)-binding protein [Acidimicrobiales bacterium]
MSYRAPSVGIIGAGASGVLAAIHVFKAGKLPGSVVLIERSEVGTGVAYSTTQQSHLLNVPAALMSALSRSPDHFVRWLNRQGSPDAGGSFVPRALYGRYLRETLRSATSADEADRAIEVVRDEVVDIVVEGGAPKLVLSQASPRPVDAVVLATGLVPPRFPGSLATAADHPRCIVNPWAPGALDVVPAGDTVTLLGTGLSAVDALLTLADRGQRGLVRAISRHGLLPAAHTPARHADALAADRGQPLGGATATARGLLRGFRQEVSRAEALGADWRDVVDLVRPRVPDLWQGLDEAEQRRFKRHLERVWNVHRHRMAPQVADRVEQLREAGVFHVHAGEVLSLRPNKGSLGLDLRLRATGLIHTWDTDWLVNCTGPDPVVFRDDQVLMNTLRARGLAIPGAHGIGVATSRTGNVLDSGGHPVEWLWAIGPLRQGDLYESTAVPEIRSQAHDVAGEIRRWLEANVAVKRDSNRAQLATAV